MAVAKGKSLKAYIEEILISKADRISIEVKENPSPSGDEWFENPENLKAVENGIKDSAGGRVKEYSMEEIKKSLGV